MVSKVVPGHHHAAKTQPFVKDVMVECKTVARWQKRGRNQFFSAYSNDQVSVRAKELVRKRGNPGLSAAFDDRNYFGAMENWRGNAKIANLCEC